MNDSIHRCQGSLVQSLQFAVGPPGLLRPVAQPEFRAQLLRTDLRFAEGHIDPTLAGVETRHIRMVEGGRVCRMGLGEDGKGVRASSGFPAHGLHDAVAVADGTITLHGNPAGGDYTETESAGAAVYGYVFTIAGRVLHLAPGTLQGNGVIEPVSTLIANAVLTAMPREPRSSAVMWGIPHCVRTTCRVFRALLILVAVFATIDTSLEKDRK